MSLKHRVNKLEQQSDGPGRHRVFYPVDYGDKYSYDGRLWTKEELAAQFPEEDTLMFIEYVRDWRGGGDDAAT